MKHRSVKSKKHRAVKSKKHRGVKFRNIKNTKNKYSGGYYKPDPETMPSKEYGIRSPDEYFVIVDPGTYEDSNDPSPYQYKRKYDLEKPTDGVIDGWMIGGGYSVTLIDDKGVTNKRISIYGNLFNKVHQKFPTSNV